MICPYCSKQAEWVSNEKIYGRRYGKSHMCYLCKDCDAYVGCHHNTRKSKGTLANAELREWRKKAHALIDPLWQSGQYKRKKVYLMLSDAFGFDIHIGESDIEQCKAIIETVKILFK